MTGYIHSVESFGAVDGPGVRFVVFFQGCPLRCLYCHNPDSWNPTDGKEISLQDLLAQILSCKSFIQNGGVTLSGGEPLLQPDFATQLISALHAQNLHTAIDTSGGVPLNQKRMDLLAAADLILLDVKSPIPQIADTITKTSGYLLSLTQTLDFLHSIDKPIWIRHVLVPQYTLDKSSILALKDLLSHYTSIQKIELLPYHNMGLYKWNQLGIPNQLENIPPVTPEQVDLAYRWLSI